MMDAHDTNLPLNQGELEEEKKTVEVSEAITELIALLIMAVGTYFASTDNAEEK